MAARLAASFRRPVLQLCRAYSAPASPASDVRAELTAAVKSAMKNKDTKTSITLRAVLAEVYSADKNATQPIDSSAVLSILKKAAVRRTDAAAQYTAAGRPELAEKETSEANLLLQFLPPTLSSAEIDDALRKILADMPSDAQKRPGNVFKVFYTVVDKSTVDAEMVKRRLNALLSTLN
ncbi:GatB YqeY domain-containing protein [Mycena albidolilacea]|uniref:Altered inheritance of mitochondria protein 41 n=1 Tax=Mycena albidolilacea TaxID=1033008 RepID=A0AAD7EV64_9AGAR|nr:GatB YqeY domain-containing protein [Mycena albidolilacea]